MTDRANGTPLLHSIVGRDVVAVLDGRRASALPVCAAGERMAALVVGGNIACVGEERAVLAQADEVLADEPGVGIEVLAFAATEANLAAANHHALGMATTAETTARLRPVAMAA